MMETPSPHCRRIIAGAFSGEARYIDGGGNYEAIRSSQIYRKLSGVLGQ